MSYCKNFLGCVCESKIDAHKSSVLLDFLSLALLRTRSGSLASETSGRLQIVGVCFNENVLFSMRVVHTAAAQMFALSNDQPNRDTNEQIDLNSPSGQTPLHLQTPSISQHRTIAFSSASQVRITPSTPG